MVIRAYELIASSPAPQLSGMLNLFNQTAREVCEGQQFDMDFEQESEITLDQYIMMIRLKTAVLLAASLRLGAIAANAGDQDAGCLYRFGIGLGIAFQLQDDLLDVYADQGEFGKITGNDIVANKKTALLVQALQMAQGADREELLHWMDNTQASRDEKIDGVRQIYDRLQLEDRTMDLIQAYHRDAVAGLDELTVNPERTVPLRELSALLMHRKK
jgi:geranylgeranyl diphosphate synthase type II